MSIEALKDALPDYAKDLKLNLSSLAQETLLTEQQRAGTFIAAALSRKRERTTANAIWKRIRAQAFAPRSVERRPGLVALALLCVGVAACSSSVARPDVVMAWPTPIESLPWWMSPCTARPMSKWIPPHSIASRAAFSPNSNMPSLQGYHGQGQSG